MPERFDRPRQPADLFAQLPDAAVERIFPPLKLARRDLEQHPLGRVAVLPHHQDGAVRLERQDRHPARMFDHLPEGGAAIGQLHSVPAHPDDFPIKNTLFSQRFLKKIHILSPFLI